MMPTPRCGLTFCPRSPSPPSPPSLPSAPSHPVASPVGATEKIMIDLFLNRAQREFT